MWTQRQCFSFEIFPVQSKHVKHLVTDANVGITSNRQAKTANIWSKWQMRRYRARRQTPCLRVTTLRYRCWNRRHIKTYHHLWSNLPPLCTSNEHGPIMKTNRLRNILFPPEFRKEYLAWPHFYTSRVVLARVTEVHTVSHFFRLPGMSRVLVVACRCPQQSLWCTHLWDHTEND